MSQPTDQSTEQLLVDTELPAGSGYRWTLDGHCARAAEIGKAVLYDLEGAGFVYVDDPEQHADDPRAWVP